MKEILISMLFISSVANAKPIVVAVIDTGFDFNSEWSDASRYELDKPKLCKFGHYDFVNKNKDPQDNHGHGTHIAGIIAQSNASNDYCIVVLKYYDYKVTSDDSLKNLLRAYRYAIDINVDVINYSGGGIDYFEKECTLMKEALDKGIEVFAAAGNEKSDLDKKPYWPALCDTRIHVVESINENNQRLPSSNFSTLKFKTYQYLGDSITSLLPNNRIGYMTGTSQATARVTSRYIQLKSMRKMKAIPFKATYINNLLSEVFYKKEALNCSDNSNNLDNIDALLRQYR